MLAGVVERVTYQNAVCWQAGRNGRNNMPPWGDVLNPEDVEALWAYFSTGEK